MTVDVSLLTQIDMTQLPPETAAIISTFSDYELDLFLEEVFSETSQEGGNNAPLWHPNPDSNGIPNPQRLAVDSEADILFYGGAAGSGKTDLLLGLAAINHKRSVIFRRVFPNHRANIERSREIFNPDGQDHQGDTFNESLHRWVLDDNGMLEFEACQHEKDKFKQRGRPRDFYGFDEVTEFTKSQFEFIIGWNRSTGPNQRCRVVCTFNPPTDESGSWVLDYIMPWLAYLYPDHEAFIHENPAAPGELRWYTTIDGKEIECENGESFEHNGETYTPRSRTFIPGRLADNPHLAESGYASVLQSLPEPLRSQMLYGDFTATAKPNPWQVIPTAWVKAAMQRWNETEKPALPLSAVGIDATRGGDDEAPIAKRYGNWIDELYVLENQDTEDGPRFAEATRQYLAGETPEYINFDVIGVGTSPYDSLKTMYNVNPVNAGARSSDYVDRSGKLKMRNIRAEYHWRMREALDPVHGDNLALPDDKMLLADLCAPRYEPTTAGIQIEPKEKIRERLGRSPDRGEAVMLAVLPDGNRKKQATSYEW